MIFVKCYVEIFLDPSDVPQMRKYRQNLQARSSVSAVSLPASNSAASILRNEAALNHSLQRPSHNFLDHVPSGTGHPPLKAYAGKNTP